MIHGILPNVFFTWAHEYIFIAWRSFVCSTLYCLKFIPIFITNYIAFRDGWAYNCQWSELIEASERGKLWDYGPLARYVKLRVAHAPGMPGTFSPRPRVSDPDMHHGTCVTHVPWCMPGLLTSGLVWSRWQGKRSRHSGRMRNPQFYVLDKRPMQSIPHRLTQKGYIVMILRPCVDIFS